MRRVYWLLIMKSEEINVLTLPPTSILLNYWFCFIFIFNKVHNFHNLLCNHSSQSLVTVLHVNQFDAHPRSIYYWFASWVLCSIFALSCLDFTFKCIFPSKKSSWVLCSCVICAWKWISISLILFREKMDGNKILFLHFLLLKTLLTLEVQWNTLRYLIFPSCTNIFFWLHFDKYVLQLVIPYHFFLF